MLSKRWRLRPRGSLDPGPVPPPAAAPPATETWTDPDPSPNRCRAPRARPSPGARAMFPGCRHDSIRAPHGPNPVRLRAEKERHPGRGSPEPRPRRSGRCRPVVAYFHALNSGVDMPSPRLPNPVRRDPSEISGRVLHTYRPLDPPCISKTGRIIDNLAVIVSAGPAITEGPPKRLVFLKKATPRTGTRRQPPPAGPIDRLRWKLEGGLYGRRGGVSRGESRLLRPAFVFDPSHGWRVAEAARFLVDRGEKSLDDESRSKHLSVERLTQPFSTWRRSTPSMRRIQVVCLKHHQVGSTPHC